MRRTADRDGAARGRLVSLSLTATVSSALADPIARSLTLSARRLMIAMFTASLLFGHQLFPLKSVSCGPAGAWRREFDEPQGVVVGGAMTSAPACCATWVVTVESGTSNATRI